MYVLFISSWHVFCLFPVDAADQVRPAARSPKLPTTVPGGSWSNLDLVQPWPLTQHLHPSVNEEALLYNICFFSVAHGWDCQRLLTSCYIMYFAKHSRKVMLYRCKQSVICQIGVILLVGLCHVNLVGWNLEYTSVVDVQVIFLFGRHGSLWGNVHLDMCLAGYSINVSDISDL